MKLIISIIIGTCLLGNHEASAYWPRPERDTTECRATTDETCRVRSNSCVAYQKDIAVYAVGAAEFVWTEVCEVKRRHYPTKVYQVERSRRIGIITQYWYTSEEALQECQTLLSQQGCR